MKSAWLLQEMCSELGIVDRTVFADNGLLTVGGVELCVMEVEDNGSDAVVVQTHYGDIPPGDLKDLMCFLLVESFLNTLLTGRYYSINPESGTVVAVRKIPLGYGVNGTMVVDIIQQEARAATSIWQAFAQH